MSTKYYLENMVENFEKLVHAIHEVGDEEQKEMLAQKFEKVKTTMLSMEVPKKKRSLDFENKEKSAKKLKFGQSSVANSNFKNFSANHKIYVKPIIENVHFDFT